MILSPTTGKAGQATAGNTQSLKTLVAVGVILLVWYGLSKIGLIPMTCMFHEVTGLHCPGCGITRMIESLLRGELYQAFRYNQFLFGLLCATPIWMGVASIAKRHAGHRLEQMAKINNCAIWLSLVGAIIFGILRNTQAFAWLAPTVVH